MALPDKLEAVALPLTTKAHRRLAENTPRLTRTRTHQPRFDRRVARHAGARSSPPTEQ